MNTKQIEYLMKESFKKRNLVISTSPGGAKMFDEAVSIERKGKKLRKRINKL